MACEWGLGTASSWLGFVWKCCVPLHPMVLLIIIPMKNGYFIGNINPTFSDKAIKVWRSAPDLAKLCIVPQETFQIVGVLLVWQSRQRFVWVNFVKNPRCRSAPIRLVYSCSISKISKISKSQSMSRVAQTRQTRPNHDLIMMHAAHCAACCPYPELNSKSTSNSSEKPYSSKAFRRPCERVGTE